MDDFMIAFILLLVTMFISRTINEKANKKLDQNKKAELIDLFSKDRIYTFGALIVIIALFFVSLRFELIDPLISYVAYVVLIFAFIAVTGFSSYRKLKTNGYPDSYIQSYLITTFLRVVGLVIFFAIVKF